MDTILIIDDQFTSRKILEELVSSLDDEIFVKTFAEPMKALEYVEIHEPDLVLADFKMPLMNGVEFTKRFRLLYKDIPLMVITGVDDKKVLYDALDAGATDFLAKPIDHRECRTRCSNLLKLRRQHQVIKGRAKWLESKFAEAVVDVRRREHETLMRLAKAGEYRDEETGNHIIRMARYSRLIANGLGLDAEECELIEYAAPMHDIGKIGISDTILLKPGRLTPDEIKVMQQHTVFGYEILRDSPSKYLQMGAVIALGHHERYDGTGYPHGLARDAIPLSARIVAIADVFDALTCARPYKKAWPIQDALNYLNAEIGKHFDPDCIGAFHAQFEKILSIRQKFLELPAIKNG